MKNFYFLFLVGFLISCTKQVAGPKGEIGTPGKSGDLVTTQTIIRKDSTEWKVNSGAWELNVFISELTNETIFNSCEVKVYRKIDSSWWALPSMIDDYIMKYGIANGYVKLNGYEFHGAPGHRPPIADFKVVLLYKAQ